jgi:hypothetical protein
MEVSNGDSTWWEDYERPQVRDEASARVAAQQLVDYFNSTLHPKEKPRTLLSVKFGAGNSLKQHRWDKQNLVTIRRRGLYFDEMKCRDCGVTGKRFGLQEVTLDRKFKAKKYLVCQAVKA